MSYKFHIDGTQEFGYSTVRRYYYSFYFFKNIVKKMYELYPDDSILDLKGYATNSCNVRLKSFNTFINVVIEHKDYVTANCILRMLGDSVAVFHLIYMEPNVELRWLRHALYVIDGCEESLKVLPEQDINKGSVPDKELVEINRQVRLNIEHRNKQINEAQQILNNSPLKNRDKEAFDKIVKDRNWKFKEFKYFSDKRRNQYKFKELYDRIEKCKYMDLFSYISQYAHGLSMSNFIVELDENNRDGLIGEAVGLLDRMSLYTLHYFADERRYIMQGLLEPQTRDRMIECYDVRYRPSVEAWNAGVMQKMKDYE